MEDPKGYYKLLGVKTNASQEEIRNAYRKKSLEVHPDTSKSTNAHREFIDLQQAYQVLRDSRTRAEYDSIGVEVPRQETQEGTTREESKEDFDPIRCSLCNCVSAQPRYVVFWETVSFLKTIRNPVQGIMCTKCAGDQAYQATKKSLIFGWWGIWGLVFTPIAVAGNISGGEKPPENNGRILLHQAWYFAKQGRLDIAYFIATDAEKFLQASNTKEKETLLSICKSIMDECKPYASGKTLDSTWEKPLPQTSRQWKAVSICAIAWVAGLGTLSNYSEEQNRKATEGAPDYSYQQEPQSTKEPETSNPALPATPPPIPKTYLPLSTGYLPDKTMGSEGGYSTITLKNNSAGNFHVKLYERVAGNWMVSREAYLKANEEFTMENISPGEYEIRRMDVQTKVASKSKIFTLEETKDTQGISYSTLTITLDVPNGNSKIIPITAKEF
jgi:hypothetical protein